MTLELRRHRGCCRPGRHPVVQLVHAWLGWRAIRWHSVRWCPRCRLQPPARSWRDLCTCLESCSGTGCAGIG